MVHEQLSPYLEHVLAVFQEHLQGIMVDPEYGEPDEEAIARLAVLLGDQVVDVRNAIVGLRQCDCLMEEDLQFEGAEGLVRWTVHPQCQREDRPDGARRVRRPRPTGTV